MQTTIIKPSAAIRQNYNEISNLAKETKAVKIEYIIDDRQNDGTFVH